MSCTTFHGRRANSKVTSRRFKAAFVFSMAVGIVASIGLASDPTTPPRVLVLYSQRRELPINMQWERGIREGVGANSGAQVAIDSEYLDFHRLESRDERQALLDLVLSKYRTIEPDIIIPVSDATAALFVRRNPFPNASIVFCSILEKTRGQFTITPQMTGVLYRFAARRTVECARRLIPSLHTVVVISGTGEQDLYLLEEIKADLVLPNEVQCEYWTGIPIDSLCAKVASLPPTHVVLFNSYMRDAAGEIATVPRDVLARIASSSSVPVFALYDTMMGTGTIGGCLAPVEEQGRLTGELAARILDGELPATIPFTGTTMNRFIFDWRQLRRWQIAEDDLPAGSVVVFREPTFLGEYRAYAVVGLSVFLLQAVLIIALLVNRRSRLRGQRELASRLQFETLLAELSSHFVHVKSGGVQNQIEFALQQVVDHLLLDGATVFALSESGRELRRLASASRSEEEAPPETIPLEAIPWLWATLNREQRFPFSSSADWSDEAAYEKNLMLSLSVKSGVIVALTVTGSVFGFLALGKHSKEPSWDAATLQRLNLVAEVISNALARARVEAALMASQHQAEQLAGRLLTAQEDERKRIARELHDDISQRLAAGAIAAGKAEQELGSPNSSRVAFAGLKQHLIVLSDDVHRLSRQLHPAILDDLGLKDALHAECDRVAERGRLAINFRCGQLPAHISKDVSLCVYRIVQEALHNVVKHAHTDRVDLTLNADLEFLDLEVRDFGRGFDSVPGTRRSGLGLASMEERVRLVGGELSITTAPGQGTLIEVRLPLQMEP